MVPSKLEKQEARSYLDQFLSSSGRLRITDHAKESMEKRNFNAQDVLHIIKRGQIKEISYNETFENWQIEIHGEDLEGDELTLQVGLDIDEKAIILITGY